MQSYATFPQTLVTTASVTSTGARNSLHSHVIETLLIAEHVKGKHDLDEKSFVAISNSGFPEAQQNITALAVCRLFAKQVGFNWQGV